MFVWDENKNLRNQTKHGLSFETVHAFNWDAAVFIDRSRHADGEQRYTALGLIDNKLHCIVFTHRDEDIRIISLRRSNKTEEKIYEQSTI